MEDFRIDDVEVEAKGYNAGFVPIEPGWKKVIIVGKEFKSTKKQDGEMLVLTYELQDGTKRKVVDRLNITNPSEACQTIGRKTLAKIAAVIGHKGALTHTHIASDTLHYRPFEVLLEVETKPSNKTNDIDPETGKQKLFRSNKAQDYRVEQSGAATMPAGATKPPMAF